MQREETSLPPTALPSHFYYAKSVSKSTVMLQVVTGCFRGKQWHHDVVVGKETVLELVSIEEDGSWVSVAETSVFGVIRDLAVLPGGPEEDDVDLLVVLSDSGMLSIVTFDTQQHMFKRKAQMRLGIQGFDRHSLGCHLAVHPQGHAIAITALQDVVSVLPVARGSAQIVEEPILHTVKGTFSSLAFLSSKTDDDCLTLAVLACGCGPAGPIPQTIITFHVSLSHRTMVVGSHVPVRLGLLLRAEFLATLLIPLEEEPDSCLVCSSCLLHVNVTTAERKNVITPPIPVSPQARTLRSSMSSPGSTNSVMAFTHRPDMLGGGFYLLTELGDVLVARRNGDSIDVHLLGHAHPGSCLVCLSNGLLIISGDIGDGSIMRENGQGTETWGLEVLNVVPNLSPVIDFQMIDVYEDGQDQLFACCGLGTHGSIRILSYGIGVNTLLSTGPHYPGVNGVWTLKSRVKDTFHSFLVLSFVSGTRVMSVGSELDDLSERSGFDWNQPTLLASCATRGWLVQVLACSVRLVKPSADDLSAPSVVVWEPPVETSIVVASASEDYIGVVLSPGNRLLVLRIRTTDLDSVEVVKVATHVSDAELSCIDLPSDDPSRSVGRFVLVGTYRPSVEVLLLLHDTNEIRSLHQELLAPFSSEGLGIPQSIRLLLSTLPCVLVGLRDGSAVHFDLAYDATSPPLEGIPLLVNPQVRRIGSYPIQLVGPFPSDSPCLLALSDRPWLIRVQKSRITCRTIRFGMVTHATPFSCEDCPEGLLFMSNNGLHIVNLNLSQKLNLSTIPLGKTPRRLLYHAASRSLVVAVFQSKQSELLLVKPEVETVQSTSSLSFAEDEVVFSMESWGSFICIGTAIQARSMGTRRGRLLLFSIAQESNEWTLRMVSSRTLPGIVQCLRTYRHEFLLATVSEKLFLFRVGDEGELVQVCRTCTRFFIACLDVSSQYIAVGDHKDSVMVFSLTESDTGHFSFVLHFRDPCPRVLSDVVILHDDTVAGVDRLGTFFSVLAKRSPGDVTPERCMEVVCQYNLGEPGLRLRTGSFVHRYDPLGTDSFVCVTLLGGVVVLHRITTTEYEWFSELETRLASHDASRPLLGNTHERFRAALGVRKNVVDGDLISVFLHLDPETQQDVVRGWTEIEEYNKVTRRIEGVHERIV